MTTPPRGLSRLAHADEVAHDYGLDGDVLIHAVPGYAGRLRLPAHETRIAPRSASSRVRAFQPATQQMRAMMITAVSY